MNKKGFVKKVEMDYAFVNVNRPHGCGGGCSCDDGACDANGLEIKVKNTLDAHEGDLVEIAMEPVRVTESIFLVYTLPMLMFIAGIFMSNSLLTLLGLGWSQGMGLFVGFLFMLMTYGCLKIYMTYTGASHRLELKMKRIVYKL